MFVSASILSGPSTPTIGVTTRLSLTYQVTNNAGIGERVDYTAVAFQPGRDVVIESVKIGSAAAALGYTSVAQTAPPFSVRSKWRPPSGSTSRDRSSPRDGA